MNQLFNNGTYAPPFPLQQSFDNLSRLQQQATMLQQQYSSPIQFPQNGVNQDILYVNGVESAKAYQVPAGSAVVLWDENDPIFYVKKRDASGQETPMKRFRYVEEADEYGSSEAYVTKEDLNVFKDEIMDLLTKPESNPKKQDNNK